MRYICLYTISKVVYQCKLLLLKQDWDTSYYQTDYKYLNERVREQTISWIHPIGICFELELWMVKGNGQIIMKHISLKHIRQKQFINVGLHWNFVDKSFSGIIIIYGYSYNFMKLTFHNSILYIFCYAWGKTEINSGFYFVFGYKIIMNRNCFNPNSIQTFGISL